MLAALGLLVFAAQAVAQETRVAAAADADVIAIYSQHVERRLLRAHFDRAAAEISLVPFGIFPTSLTTDPARPAWPLSAVGCVSASRATRSALLLSVRLPSAPEHCPQDANEEQCCDWPMEPDPVQAGENIDQDQKARNCQGHRKGARQVRQPVRDARPRGWLVSVANPLSTGFRPCNCFRLGRRAFVSREATSGGSAAHGHSIAGHRSNVLHRLLAETVEANG